MNGREFIIIIIDLAGPNLITKNVLFQNPLIKMGFEFSFIIIIPINLLQLHHCWGIIAKSYNLLHSATSADLAQLNK